MSAAKREALSRFLSGSDLLAAHEPRKEALLLDEVIVTALLNHPALFDHVNAIGASQRAEPVRYQNPSGLQSLQAGCDRRLGAIVQRAGSFVENQNRWFVDQRARNQEPLALPAGQVAA